MADDNRELDSIDDAPLRDVEIQELRLLLEQERARRRLSRKMKYWLTWISLGGTTLVAGNQLGVLDMIAGMFVKGRH